MAALRNGGKIVMIVLSLFLFSSSSVFAFDISEVKSGDKVTLIRAMDDGVTYYVRTSAGIEIWKDRGLYHFVGIEERCTVIKSLGSEVLLYVPIMNTKYWFTVMKVGVKMRNKKRGESVHEKYMKESGIETIKETDSDTRKRGKGSAAGSYSGVGSGHWIRENIDSGSVIILEDGSVWKIDPIDKIAAMLWLPVSNITVVESSSGFPGFNYLLINTNNNQKAHAKHIGSK